jgi:hypothetical protein
MQVPPTSLSKPKVLGSDVVIKPFLETEGSKKWDDFIEYRDTMQKKEIAKAELETMIALYTMDFRQGLIQGDSNLMKELTGTNVNDLVAEPAHQTKYVKSLIGDLIGVTLKGDTKIGFDVHGQVVSSTLRQNSREGILKAFARYDTPEAEIAYLTKRLNEQLVNENDQSTGGGRQIKRTIAMMDHFFDAPTKEEFMKGVMPFTGDAQYFTFKNYGGAGFMMKATKEEEEDDDFQAFPVAIKEEGVKQLLVKMGRLKVVDVMGEE